MVPVEMESMLKAQSWCRTVLCWEDHENGELERKKVDRRRGEEGGEKQQSAALRQKFTEV